MNDRRASWSTAAPTADRRRWPERTIELIVMPYEEETLVAHEGRMVREVVSRGAFDGIERRANRIKVNRDHDVSAHAAARRARLHPARPRAWWPRSTSARSPLGDETLTLAEEGILDAWPASCRCPAASAGRSATGAASTRAGSATSP